MLFVKTTLWLRAKLRIGINMSPCVAAIDSHDVAGLNNAADIASESMLKTQSAPIRSTYEWFL